MARPGMPEKFNGWQIIDATPLRRSDGIMRCGPASLEAVKLGYTDYQYDSDFLFDLLNADIRHIVVDEESELGEYQLPKNNYRQVVRLNKILHIFNIFNFLLPDLEEKL